MATSRFDPQPPDKSTKTVTTAVGEASPAADSNESAKTDDATVLQLVKQAMASSRDYHAQNISGVIASNYRAWRNEHSQSSKYLGPAFKGRSRLFVPKTRSAVRKNLAGAAAALFSTDDAVNISAEHEDDDVQRASAAVIKEDMNYRLSRTSKKSGMPWFLISMGGALDAQLTGITVSKQFWDYEEIETAPDEMVDERGEFEGQSEPVKKRVIRDRPFSELIPIENCYFDPAAPWHDPVQLGAWWIVRYPMRLGDVKAMIQGSSERGMETQWRPYNEGMILQGRADDSERSGVRRAREGGDDSKQANTTSGELEIVWIQENFLRRQGRDMHFWSVGDHYLLSDPVLTEEEYPALRGERPYTMGVGQLDSHRIVPMSSAESWQPLQAELNDVTNIRLDTLKRSIAPLAKVIRGRNVDLQQLLRRGMPDAVIQVTKMDDVEFEKTPGPGAGAFQETATVSANFDELAGVFSTSSVQNDRRLNETVGGMRLMAGAANSVSEFDLRVWVETWVEPTLRQIIHLIQYNENDETVLALSGSKARTLMRYGVSPTMDEVIETEVALRVNVGIGASDPMQKLAKFKAALEMLAPIFEELKSQGVSLSAEDIIEEVMGSAGYRDGRRFFKFRGEDQQQQDQEGQIPPEMMQFIEELKLKRDEIQSEVAMNREDNQTKLQIAQMTTQEQRRAKAIDAFTNMFTGGGSGARQGRDDGGSNGQGGARSPSSAAGSGAQEISVVANQVAEISQQVDRIMAVVTALAMRVGAQAPMTG